MSTADDNDRSTCPPQSRPARWGHFSLAAGVLLFATVGWNVVLRGSYFAKKPVLPPVIVETEEHRLVSFPKKIGPYVLAEDGQLSDGKLDGSPDGIIEIREDVLDTLGTLGNENNWYYMAIYRDTRDRLNSRNRFFRIDITYYTGLLEAVPHVAERCIIAGGGAILQKQKKLIAVNIPLLPAKWKDKWQNIKVFRTPYEIPQSNGRAIQSAQYHIFSMNGVPTARWEAVRWKLGSPSLEYCYFAKIQVASIGPAESLEASDDLCRDFLKYILPEVLRFLPTEEDVKRLETGQGS